MLAKPSILRNRKDVVFLFPSCLRPESSETVLISCKSKMMMEVYACVLCASWLQKGLCWHGKAHPALNQASSIIKGLKFLTSVPQRLPSPNASAATVVRTYLFCLFLVETLLHLPPPTIPQLRLPKPGTIKSVLLRDDDRFVRRYFCASPHYVPFTSPQSNECNKS